MMAHAARGPGGGGRDDERKAALGVAYAEALATSALPGEIDDFGDDARAAAGAFIAAAAAQRLPGQPVIELTSMTGNGRGRVMRLVVINDDMPFLVDSVAMTVAAEGLNIRRILHPVAAVRRDSSGVLHSVAPRGESGERRESVIYLETDRGDARQRRALVAALTAALDDVRCAVRDWPAMQAALRADADALADDEAAALLRWFVDGQLTQLGHERRRRDGSFDRALGICDGDGPALLSDAALADAFTAFDRGARVPMLVKSNRLSGVHRRVLIDLVICPVHGDGGVVALSTHASLWTSAALSAPPAKVPMLRTALARMMDKYGFDPVGHAGKALAHALTALPHDLLVGADPAALEALALTSMSLTDRPRPKLYALIGALRRHVHVFVWLPRDDVSTGQRLAIETMLAAGTNARAIGWSIALDEGGTALLRYTLDVRGGGRVPDVAELDQRLKQLVRGWLPAVEAELAQLGEESRATVLATRFANQLPANYRNLYGPAEAAQDILRLRQLGEDLPQSVRLITADPAAIHVRLKVYALGGALPLSRVVPVLENFGFSVLEEVPSRIGGAEHGADGAAAADDFIHDFLLALPTGVTPDALTQRAAIIEGAIAATIGEKAENDAFNSLILTAEVDPAAAVWLRAWFRYLRQTGMPYGLVTAVAVLRASPAITAAMIARFVALHDPSARDDARAVVLADAISAQLEQVASIDDDRVLRLYHALISATLRTNAFAPAAAEALAFKLDSAAIPGLPKPLPWREIFVYSSRLEGVHLRAGPVARGGLRWSDRRDDFRTEILGLMKAQRVKNAVIVPTGAKGGFYPKNLPDPAADRDAWLAEGTECYRIFIRAMLSVTDNLVGGAVVHPAAVTVRDGDDPYFVVAADKGTATFSDVANALAMERDFWLGDAFASGGSNGYDHKAMGITARGAWVSVQRHFAELGTDVQSDSISVAGCGDMSGDVFGNGMLLSTAIRLVAAFDHRHIFLDPAPDPAASHAERARLFALPRSSWADYDPALISPGGGVFPRSQKRIPLSEPVRAVLGVEDAELAPSALIAAIVRAPVDLMWFGGIGTYIKAAAQNNADVGDPANDGLRVDAESLLCRAIGEGANLGMTQAARIAFSARGGRVNTDFIDNSAGVDCSDNEVNIKIALNAEMAAGRLTLDDRNRLLIAMTDAVAAHVLEDNRLQALALSIAEAGGAESVPAMLRIIDMFEATGRLDRAVEGLAGNDILLRRIQEGQGLFRPELAVVMATAKLALQQAVEDSDLANDPSLADELTAAFPPAMQDGFADAIASHPLRREIIATRLANRIVNRLGVILPFELVEEQGSSLAALAASFVAAERLLDMGVLWDALDRTAMPEQARLALFTNAAGAMTSHMADLLGLRGALTRPGALVTRLAPVTATLMAGADGILSDTATSIWTGLAERLADANTPPDLAARTVALFKTDGVVGLADLAERRGSDAAALARAFCTLGAALGIDWAQTLAARLSPPDPWERLLVNSLAREFQQMRLDFLARHDPADPQAAVEGWLAEHADRVAHYHALVKRTRTHAAPGGAMLAHLATQARSLLAG